MKKVLLILLALVLALSLGIVGCAAPAEQEEEEEEEEEFEFPDPLGVSVDELGTTGYAFTLAYTPVMEEHFGVTVRTLPSATKSASIQNIKDGRAYFIGGWNDINGVIANEGTGEYASPGWGPQKTVSIWYNNGTYYAWIVRGDSEIEAMTAEDLSGKRVAFYQGSPMYMSIFDASLAFAGLTRDDVELVEVGSYSAAARAIPEGKADIVQLATTSGVTFEIAENPHGVRVIAFPTENEEGWNRFKEIAPLGAAAECDMGIPAAIGVEVIIFDYQSATLLDVDDELIYRVAKFMDEAFDEYKDNHPNCINMAREKTAQYIERTALPFHPGAVRYFKEIGIWDEDDEEWNNERLGWFDLYEEAWQDALEEAAEQQITVDAENQEWLDLWASACEGLPRFLGR
jgi:hypothetical protein